MSTLRPACVRHREAAVRSEHGSSTLELAIIFPALLLILLATVQGALWYHAKSVALAAAQEGARAAVSETGSQNAGVEAAASFANRAGAGTLTASRVNVIRTGTTATVTLTGGVIAILPGTPTMTVTQSATLPVERVTR